MLPDHQPSLLIFGYGSLIWNPGFEFYDSRKAYAIGFARRMYQGNTFHRGNLKQVNQEKIIALRESERKARKGGGDSPTRNIQFLDLQIICSLQYDSFKLNLSIAFLSNHKFSATF